LDLKFKLEILIYLILF